MNTINKFGAFVCAQVKRARTFFTSPLLHFLTLLILFIAIPAEAQYVSETLTLKAGWNAVYLESTPEENLCDAFFADLPEVTRAALYRGEAFSPTARIGADGTERPQPPLAYFPWVRGAGDGNLMKRLVGGRCYLIYATAACAKTFLGVPQQPRTLWHRADAASGDVANLVGVSLAPDAPKVTAVKYFGDGPYGTKSGKISTIGGSSEDQPTSAQMMFGTPTVESGRAYALSAERSGEDAGVVDVRTPGGVVFPEDGSYATFRFRNGGATARTFRLRLAPSAKSGEAFPAVSRQIPRTELLGEDTYSDLGENAEWDISLEADETATILLRANRDAMSASDATYAAVLEVTDLGGSAMRVRTPLRVAFSAAGDGVSWDGLWAGKLLLTDVSMLSSDTNAVPEPVTAAGLMKAGVLVLVNDGKATLLQRATVAGGTNGVVNIFRDETAAAAYFASNRNVVAWSRRLTSGMIDVANQTVACTTNSGQFGAGGANVWFRWTVGEKAKDNPFRHAWHPDHDGKTADYSTDAPSGDDLSNYRNPVKPELWSITNELKLEWFKTSYSNDPEMAAAKESAEQMLSPGADDDTVGLMTWTVWGLTSKPQPIVTEGVFYLKRVMKGRFEVGKVEK